jgi:DNA-binding XRE family transcriptional regulator
MHIPHGRAQVTVPHGFLHQNVLPSQGDALRKSRAEMTQGELVEKAGVSRATINRIEQGHAELVTSETGHGIARALDADADA